MFQADNHSDLEIRDRDAESKGKAKLYADARQNAKYSEVQVGDQVLVKQEKNKQVFYPVQPRTIHNCEQNWQQCHSCFSERRSVFAKHKPCAEVCAKHKRRGNATV